MGLCFSNIDCVDQCWIVCDQTCHLQLKQLRYKPVKLYCPIELSDTFRCFPTSLKLRFLQEATDLQPSVAGGAWRRLHRSETSWSSPGGCRWGSKCLVLGARPAHCHSGAAEAETQLNQMSLSLRRLTVRPPAATKPPSEAAEHKGLHTKGLDWNNSGIIIIKSLKRRIKESWEWKTWERGSIGF